MLHGSREREHTKLFTKDDYWFLWNCGVVYTPSDRDIGAAEGNAAEFHGRKTEVPAKCSVAFATLNTSA